MFIKIENTTFLFELLDQHFKSSINFNDNQVFILTEPSFYLIQYFKSTEKEELLGFEIPKTVDFSQAAQFLLMYFEEQIESGKTEFEKASSVLTDHLIQQQAHRHFFDAH
jgi:hypothetical protein